MLLFDFTHHNIEMSCSLLESCGRFLYRTNDSHQRVKVYLVCLPRMSLSVCLSVSRHLHRLSVHSYDNCQSVVTFMFLICNKNIVLQDYSSFVLLIYF